MIRAPLPTSSEVSDLVAELLALPNVARLTDGLTLSPTLAPPNPDDEGPACPFQARQVLRAIRDPQRLRGPLPRGAEGTVVPFVPLISEDRREVRWQLQVQRPTQVDDHGLRFRRTPHGWEEVR